MKSEHFWSIKMEF